MKPDLTYENEITLDVEYSDEFYTLTKFVSMGLFIAFITITMGAVSGAFVAGIFTMSIYYATLVSFENDEEIILGIEQFRQIMNKRNPRGL